MFELSLIKNRISKLEKKISNFKCSIKFDSKKDRLQKITSKLKQSNIWKQSKLLIKINQERSSLEEIIYVTDDLSNRLKYIADLFKLSIEEKNKENIFQEITETISLLEEEINRLELHFILFKKKNDQLHCYMDIQSGSGGMDAQDWANILFKMYLRWANYHNFKTKIIGESGGEKDKIKSVTIEVIGKFAYGWLRTETGIHRLVRRSPFDSGKRRHTSFCSIFVYPKILEKISIDIRQSDLRIDVYRSSSAGGQHVNRTESAVRITHLPTKIVTQCQNERSQHKNKSQAMKQLKLKLYKLELYKKNLEKRKLDISKSDISWGHQIRSYVLDDSRVKDLRSGMEIYDVQSILNGRLDKFIITNLKLGF